MIKILIILKSMDDSIDYDSGNALEMVLCLKEEGKLKDVELITLSDNEAALVQSIAAGADYGIRINPPLGEDIYCVDGPVYYASSVERALIRIREDTASKDESNGQVLIVTPFKTYGPYIAESQAVPHLSSVYAFELTGDGITVQTSDDNYDVKHSIDTGAARELFMAYAGGSIQVLAVLENRREKSRLRNTSLGDLLTAMEQGTHEISIEEPELHRVEISSEFSSKPKEHRDIVEYEEGVSLSPIIARLKKHGSRI